MGSKKKILEYIDFKGISAYSFEKKLGLSNGSLKSGREFGVDKIKLIRDNYPDLNVNWLLFDEGEMLVNARFNELKEPQTTYKTSSNIEEQLEIIERKLDYLLVFNKIDVEAVNALMIESKKERN